MDKNKIKRLVDLLPAFWRESIGFELTDNSKVLLGSSKIGGTPDVSPDFVWPTDDEGRPLSLLMQIDCSDIQVVNQERIFPKDGHLYFFLELSNLPSQSINNKVCVLYSDTPTSQLVKTNFPESLFVEGRLKERSINLHKINSLPLDEDLMNMNVGHSYSDYEELESAYKLLEYVPADEAGFFGTMLGYAIPIQDSVIDDLENEVLLLQLFSFQSTDCQLMFGDWGYIYFTISKKDLIAKKFNEVKFHLQYG